MKTAKRPGVCSICWCRQERACEDGCAWADRTRTLCSSCTRFARYTRAEVVALARFLCILSEKRVPHFLDYVVRELDDYLESLKRTGFTILPLSSGARGS